MKFSDDIKDFLIPAVDVLDGNVVRLKDGDVEKNKVYFDNPKEAMAYWREKGASRIHLVDLDRAIHGNRANWECIKEAVESVDVSVCLSGGLRNMSDIKEAFDIGVSSISLGTLALNDPITLQKVIDLYGDKIYVSLDYKKNKLWGYGWTFSYGYDFFDFLKTIEDMGVKSIIYTDIERYGTMGGYDRFFLYDILDKTFMNVIVSGGIGSLEDILMLQSECRWGWGNGKLIGAICGSALYEGKIQNDLKNAKK